MYVRCSSRSVGKFLSGGGQAIFQGERGSNGREDMTELDVWEVGPQQ